MFFLSAYKENVRVVYASEAFSRASFFNLIVFVVVIICPYLIAYRSEGFWNKFDLVREQPIVNFKHEVLFVLQLKNDVNPDHAFKTLVWTTVHSLNQLLQSKITPFIASRQLDSNLDGIHEGLDLQVTIPIEKNFRVKSFHLLLLFDYQLLKYSSLHMESLAYIYYQVYETGNKFNIFADLDLVYKTPLRSHVRDERYNKDVIPRKSASIQDYEIAKILQSYSSRNVTTILKDKYEFMEDDSEIETGDFMFNIHLGYPETSYECWAGIWNTLKWAWIQYLAIFVVIFALMRKFQKMAYKADLFEIRKKIPWETKQGARNIISHNQKCL